MGKMRLGSTGQQQVMPLEPALSQTPGVSQEQFDMAMKEVMERHSDTFKRLAAAELAGKNAPLATMQPSACLCSQPLSEPKKLSDRWSRKHTIAVRKQLEADHKQLDGLLAMYAESTDKKLKALEAGLHATNDYIHDINETIPEEIQVVKETIIEKPVTDPKVWMAIGLAVLLNIAFILLK